MKYYFNNFIALISLQSKLLIEDRANGVGQFVISIFEIIGMVIFIEVLFQNTNNISGWNKNELFLFTGLFRVFSAIFATFFLSSVNRIPYYVKTGELDLFLTKPISSQFYISFRQINIPKIVSIISGLVLAIYALQNLQSSLFNVFLLVLGVLVGVIIFYSIYYLIATLAIWLGSFESLFDISYIMHQPLMVPVDILGKPVSLIITYIIPLGFVITVPAQIFLNKSPSYLFAFELVIAIIFLFFSSWFWNFSLKHYTSASS